ncbi:LysR family transcriptional regulator [Enterobacteriaceae bacterium ML5]|nr:LysR family transcriptional regulator [Enterobacteriaceae bacterium ML5]
MNFLLSRKMKYFIVTMEKKCINAAAEKLFITRSPLGKVITELEDVIGSKLFERSYNELVPTSVAVELYKRLKPIYDSLSIIEEKFHSHGEDKTLEVIFDVSVPYNLYKYIVYALQVDEVNFTHSRILVTQETVKKAGDHHHIVIISMRDFKTTDSVYKEMLNEDTMVLLMSSFITEAQLNDDEFMRKVPLMVRQGDSACEIKIRVSSLLRDTLPYVYYKEVEADLTTMFYSVVNAKGILLLPRKLAELFSSPAISKNKIKGYTYRSILLHNVKLKNDAGIKKIKKALSCAL